MQFHRVHFWVYRSVDFGQLEQGAPLVAFRLYTISPRGKKRYIEGRGDISRYKILLPPLRERSRPLFHFVTPRAHSREAFNGDFNTFLQTNWSIGYYRTTSGALQSTGEASPPSPRSHDQSTILKNSRRNIRGKKRMIFVGRSEGAALFMSSWLIDSAGEL